LASRRRCRWRSTLGPSTLVRRGARARPTIAPAGVERLERALEESKRLISTEARMAATVALAKPGAHLARTT
jgi:hypothetical protein